MIRLNLQVSRSFNDTVGAAHRVLTANQWPLSVNHTHHGVSIQG